jgi:hypothetical protein
VFTRNPFTYDALVKIANRLGASIGGHTGNKLLLHDGGVIWLDEGKLKGTRGEELRVHNHAGMQYTDIFVLDSEFTRFQYNYMLTRRRSKCNIPSKFYIGDEQ